MAFTFLHTADWQIGRRFGRFPTETATLLGQARLDIVDSLAQVAKTHGVRHILVAGDVFDSETIPEALSRRLLARLGAHAGLDWHLLPGNHDPARPGGIWHAIRHLLPANVRAHVSPEPIEIEPGVLLLPAPLGSRATTIDPTAWMDAAASPPFTRWRIGLAHGSVRGFGSLNEAATTIAPDRAATAGLDYLALGDWHGMLRIGPRTWYSGTPEADSFADNAPGHALVVHLSETGPPPAVTPVATSTYRWLSRRLRVARIEDIEALIAEIDDLGPAASHHLLDLTLEGRLPLDQRLRLEEHTSLLESRLMHLRCDRAGLRLSAEAVELEALQAGAVRSVAERLVAAARSDDPQAVIAAEALSRLLMFDALVDDGGDA